MSLGGGHIFDMIARMKSNASLLKKDNTYKRQRRYSKKREKQFVRQQELSESDKKLIKHQLVQAEKIAFKKSIIALFISLIVCGGLIYWFLKSLES